MWLAILGAALVVGGAIVAHAVIVAPTVGDEPAPADVTAERSTATATALLRPDDPTLPDIDAQLIAIATARAVDYYASYLIALRSGVDADALARLREQMYADLRESLTAPQLARALVIGLHPRADERARVLVNQFRSLPTRVESR